ncbi:MAG: GDSL-type esterase/lipase family protein [Planctomycetota bacterium]|nr:GDSL-type esterase/lipase family protein [Planctomycetota bacterium]
MTKHAKPYLFACALLALALAARAGEGPVIHAMEELKFRAPQEKAAAELVEGHSGKAVKFNFEKDARNAFFMGQSGATPEWDQAAGFSFWVKGDGSAHCGGLQFIWNEDYAARYDFCFPISGTEWTKVAVRWSDLIPALPKEQCKFLDAKAGNAPSKLGALWIGKWWYWKSYEAHSYALDEFRLEPELPAEAEAPKPAGAPLARVLEKLKAGQPVTVVTMGDSLTDYAHWANKPGNWPNMLKAQLEAKYKSQVTIVNPAMGGTELRQNLVVIPRWAQQAPEPDLVTVCFGFNDWNSGMRGARFEETLRYGVARIRRLTGGKADVLLMTTSPALEHWDTFAELAEAARKAAAETHAGLADVYKAMHEAGGEDRARLFVNDKTHLGQPGHEIFAKTVLAAIESGGK